MKILTKKESFRVSDVPRYCILDLMCLLFLPMPLLNMNRGTQGTVPYPVLFLSYINLEG
jgi:hypothetical protein